MKLTQSGLRKLGKRKKVAAKADKLYEAILALKRAVQATNDPEVRNSYNRLLAVKDMKFLAKVEELYFDLLKPPAPEPLPEGETI